MTYSTPCICLCSYETRNLRHIITQSSTTTLLQYQPEYMCTPFRTGTELLGTLSQKSNLMQNTWNATVPMNLRMLSIPSITSLADLGEGCRGCNPFRRKILPKKGHFWPFLGLQPPPFPDRMADKSSHERLQPPLSKISRSVHELGYAPSKTGNPS